MELLVDRHGMYQKSEQAIEPPKSVLGEVTPVHCHTPKRPPSLLLPTLGHQGQLEQAPDLVVLGHKKVLNQLNQSNKLPHASAASTTRAAASAPSYASVAGARTGASTAAGSVTGSGTARATVPAAGSGSTHFIFSLYGLVMGKLQENKENRLVE